MKNRIKTESFTIKPTYIVVHNVYSVDDKVLDAHLGPNFIKLLKYKMQISTIKLCLLE